jgi:Domain of unknown function (DUF4338)
VRQKTDVGSPHELRVLETRRGRATFRVSIPRSESTKATFLTLLASDLNSVGIPVTCLEDGAGLCFEGTSPSAFAQRQADVPSLIRNRQVEAAHSVLDRVNGSELRELFVGRGDVDTGRISPSIRFCKDSQDALLFSYCRLSQGVPSARRIGRQIRALILDLGQRRPAIMGVIGLASGTYTSRARDVYLGWSGRESRRIREIGLRRMMALALCMAVPPYSEILGGKLMALLALSQPFCEEFRSKYGDELLALETTCASGLHCPIFHRLTIRPGGLYRRIGQTAGYSTSLFSLDTVRAAREVLAETRGTREGLLSGSTKPLVTLRYALRACGLPEEGFLMSGNPKGIYFASRGAGCTDLLREGVIKEPPLSFSADGAVNYWRLHLLPKRLGGTPATNCERVLADTTETSK